ncbi:hypothetical protein ACJX0J_008736, partial [Zea mays]
KETVPVPFTTRLYTNSSSSTSTSVISTSTSAISTSTSASTNRIYNSDNKCGLSKTLMTEQNNSAKQIKASGPNLTVDYNIVDPRHIVLYGPIELEQENLKVKIVEENSRSSIEETTAFAISRRRAIAVFIARLAQISEINSKYIPEHNNMIQQNIIIITWKENFGLPNNCFIARKVWRRSAYGDHSDINRTSRIFGKKNVLVYHHVLILYATLHH